MAKKVKIEEDNRVDKFEENYMKVHPWNYLLSPSRPKMVLWIYPDGTTQLMEADIAADAREPRIYGLPTMDYATKAYKGKWDIHGNPVDEKAMKTLIWNKVFKGV